MIPRWPPSYIKMFVSKPSAFQTGIRINIWKIPESSVFFIRQYISSPHKLYLLFLSQSQTTTDQVINYKKTLNFAYYLVTSDRYEPLNPETEIGRFQTRCNLCIQLFKNRPIVLEFFLFFRKFKETKNGFRKTVQVPDIH